jgi:hypothetical protein
LKSIAVVRRFTNTEDFFIISEKKIPRVINYVTQVIHEHVEKQRPKTDPCETPESIIKGDERILETRT